MEVLVCTQLLPEQPALPELPGATCPSWMAALAVPGSADKNTDAAATIHTTKPRETTVRFIRLAPSLLLGVLYPPLTLGVKKSA